MQKTIVIIDCFVQSQSLEEKLISCVRRLKSKGLKIMLVTNTPVEREIVAELDHLLFDSENRLFDDTMEAKHISLIKTLNGMRVVEVVKGVQRHGLSVLRNLKMALKMADAYGYTHFHRVEVDDLMGEASIDFVSRVPQIVSENGKRGMFFLNDNSEESNISFHYMYCEIKLFLESVVQVETQGDYQEYLLNQMGADTFRNVEEFVRHNIDRVVDQLQTYPGFEMQLYFPDTMWNTETSQSNLESKYQSCTTRLYRTIHNGLETDFNILLTYNYGNVERSRQINLLRNGEVVGILNHYVKDIGWWQTNHVSKDVDSIAVLENGEEIYTEHTSSNFSAQHIELY